MIQRMQRANVIVEELAFQPVSGRLARLLLEDFKNAGDAAIARHLTLDEMASRVGTTREMVLPHLAGENHLIAGQDIFIAFSPERVDPGRKDWTTKNTPKVVGGITQDCSDVASAWYQQALEIKPDFTEAHTNLGNALAGREAALPVLP